MRKQMQSSDAIKSKGLEYSALLAAEAPDEDHICFLLEVLGVHCCGPYACLCKCGNDQRVCAYSTPLRRVSHFFTHLPIWIAHVQCHLILPWTVVCCQRNRRRRISRL